MVKINHVGFVAPIPVFPALWIESGFREAPSRRPFPEQGNSARFFARLGPLSCKGGTCSRHSPMLFAAHHAEDATVRRFAARGLYPKLKISLD
jgi:hypothetical protein